MLPGLSVTQDGVCDDEELSHEGDEGDLAWPAVLADEAIVEVLELGGMREGGASAVEEKAPHLGSTMADALAAFDLAAALGMGRQSDEGGDLLAGEVSEFGQVGEQGDDGRRPNAADALQELSAAGQLGIGGDVGLDGGIDGLEAFLEGSADLIEALANDGAMGVISARLLGMDGVGELAPSGSKSVQNIVAELLGLNATTGELLGGIVGDEAGIDGIGLGGCRGPCGSR